MTEWFELDDWIFVKQTEDYDWEIPENTMTFKKGIDADIKQLSLQLGLKLKIVAEV